MQQWPQNNHKKYLTSGIHLVISKIATMSKEATLVMDHSNSSIGILHYASVWFWLGTFSFYFFLILYAPLLWWLAPEVLCCLSLLIAVSGAHSVKGKVPDWAKSFGDSVIYKCNEYFSMKVYVEDAEALMKKTEPVIFAIEPHDILPVCMAALADPVNVFPGIHAEGCVTSIAYKIPILKHIFTWVGSGSIDKKNLIRMISKGKSPMICIGGAHEVIYMKNRTEYVLYMHSRFGYIKLAMEQGIDIVPTFAFGQRHAWDFYVPGADWIHALGRKIGFIPMIFFGLWGIPLGPPKRTPVTVVIGAPIAVPKIKNPTLEQLSEYSAKVIESVKRIFEENKDKHGAAGCTLKVL